MKKNKKILIFLGSLLVVGTGISISLSSCSSSSSTNPYAPYTAININNENAYIRYETSKNTSAYFNSDANLFGAANANKYLDIKTIADYYYQISAKRVDDFLNNQTNWTSIKTLYGDDSAPDVAKDKYFQKIQSQKQSLPSFFYGVSPTIEMVQIANIYNRTNILNNIYISIKDLVNQLINYIIHVNSQKINDLNFSSVSDFNTQWFSSSYSKELIFGKYCTVGQGNNIYQLWPSGLSFDIIENTNNTNVNAGLNTIENIVDYKNKTKLGDINSPFPIAQYNNDNNGIIFPNKQISVTNININFSWFKTNRSGGSYVDSINDINNALNVENKQMLNEIGITDKKINNMSYKLPISNLNFNVIPITQSYEDPWYSGVYNTVYTGLYTIGNPIINKPTNKISADSFKTYIYPESLKTIIDNNSSINWRGIVNVNQNKPELLEKYIPNDAFNSIKNSTNMQNVPYYQSNLNFASDLNKKNFSISNININNTNYQLTNDQMNSFLSIFIDPFNKTNKWQDAAIYNNINNLEKINVLNFCGLGLLLQNNAIIDLSKNAQFINIKKSLAFGNDNVKASNIKNANLELFNLGQNAFNQIIKINQTKIGNIYKFNNNGISATTNSSLANLSVNLKINKNDDIN